MTFVARKIKGLSHDRTTCLYCEVSLKKNGRKEAIGNAPPPLHINCLKKRQLYR